ncbi:MAG: hypothetical protein MI866_21330 [Bacteroidales bacterium]|nr:hypothetical protein [Bacteroidales bacterium]
MKIFKNILLTFILCACSFSCFGQLLETRQLISFNSGYGVLNGVDDNLFFPSSVKQSGLSIDLSYGHKITPWLAGGVSIGYIQFASPDTNPGFAEIKTNSSTSFLTVGPQVILHSPFKSQGVFNRIRLGLAIVPQFHHYSGERSVKIDNVVIPANKDEMILSVIEMNKNSTGFGAKIGPEINYRITQRFGLRLAYNWQLLSVYSGYDREQLVANSVLGGLIFTFGNRKALF